MLVGLFLGAELSGRKSTNRLGGQSVGNGALILCKVGLVFAGMTGLMPSTRTGIGLVVRVFLALLKGFVVLALLVVLVGRHFELE